MESVEDWRGRPPLRGARWRRVEFSGAVTKSGVPNVKNPTLHPNVKIPTLNVAKPRDV